MRDDLLQPQGFALVTEVNAPKGSGMWTSSTVTITVLGAFAEWLNLPLGEYEVARLAYEIEASDLGMTGERQDQYAATFGGSNYMEIYAEEKVIANLLRVKRSYQKELEHNLLVYYNGRSRLSAKIIEWQTAAFAKTAPTKASVTAAHTLKAQAVHKKEALLMLLLHEVGALLDCGWQNEKCMAEGITTPVIDDRYGSAPGVGAIGRKISGAGGGGFMRFYCPGLTRHRVAERLCSLGDEQRLFLLLGEGMVSRVG